MPKLEITEEMLDVIEIVKGRREANNCDRDWETYLLDLM